MLNNLMKSLLIFGIIQLLAITSGNAQAFYGKGDVIFQVGANLQNNGTGVTGSLDFGLGDNFSVGVSSAYLLGIERVKDAEGNEVPIAEFEDRIDVKGRINANLGNVIGISDHLDIYPGLYVSMKNFGGHFGVRYFFTYGFGLYSEINFPISKFNTGTLTPAEKLHNQTSFNIGVAFGI